MSDLKLGWVETGNGDYLPGHDDDGLKTAVLISLFTDKRANAEDELPWGENDLRGYWGDTEIGSKLWLLSRRKITPETRKAAIQYARDSLLWLKNESIVDAVEVDAEWMKGGMLGLLITISRNGRKPTTYKFSLNWEKETNDAV